MIALLCLKSLAKGTCIVFSRQNSVPLDFCLACGSDNLKLTLDLKTQPLANSYKKSKYEAQEVFPLAINRCTDCYHVQLTHAVNPDLMFKDYLYVSGTSQTMRDHFAWFAKWATEYTYWGAAESATTVLDIGCNDGSQLDQFKKLGLSTTGIDPALNLYPISSKNHTVFPQFFDYDFITKNPGTFDILVAQNVFAHNYSPKTFLTTARNVMHPNSFLFVQTSQADMILNNEFDTIYHEHISFYNINSMNELCKRSGMYLIDAIKCPLHGNSYIFVISINKDFMRPFHIKNLIEMERKAGLLTEQTYIDYAAKCNAVVTDLKAIVEGYTRNDMGWNAVGYGAAAKGMTLLNYSGIKLDCIIDDNPLKQGLFTPGSSIPICGPEKLAEYEGDTMFIPLAWNFFDEIKSKIVSKRNGQNDMFITYFPKVEIRR